MKKILALFCSLLLAGSVFLACGWAGRVRRDVTIGGVQVGGMTYAEAERAVRETLSVPFVLHTPAGDVTPTLSYSDDVSLLVRRAKKGAVLTPQVRRAWADAEVFLEDVCAKCVQTPVDAVMQFTSEGFTYTQERAGVYCDYAASLAAALAAIGRGEREATLVTRVWRPAVTERQLRARTQRLARFTTYFDGEKSARVHNISLACGRIAGTVLAPGETLSFNDVVGERTRENGFQDAAVILNGEFVQGTGGGVCQVSTTLMGAAVRAGLVIRESHPHSLSVGYVQPSQDAMVSRYSDLKLRNPYAFPVYFLGKTAGSSITFEIFGAPDGKRYDIESCVLEYIDPPPAEVRQGEENRTVRAEKQGLRSESYLVTYAADGSVISRKLLRRDSYAAVQGIYVVSGAQQAQGGEGTEEAPSTR